MLGDCRRSGLIAVIVLNYLPTLRPLSFFASFAFGLLPSQSHAHRDDDHRTREIPKIGWIAEKPQSG